MASASTLTTAEISLIESMFALDPPLSKQEILAYFTRPGRDINHRVIDEISRGIHSSHVQPASMDATFAYMRAMLALSRPDPEILLANSNNSSKAKTSGRIARLSLNYWPVGQGLFASGTLFQRQSKFEWVYDCGSISTKAVNHAIRLYIRQRKRGGSSSINLVVLSHFDSDHISGVVELIRNFPARILLLPYVPLWQRLIIAAEQGIDVGDPLMEFFVDPASYLSREGRGEVTEIIFVPPAGSEDPVSSSRDEPGRPPESEEARDSDLRVESDAPPTDAQADPILQQKISASVRFLKKTGRLILPRLWEFVPYNDARMLPQATPAFLSRAAYITNIFLADEVRRTKALMTLKSLYDHHFGPSPRKRNLISLFLYSGPVGQPVLRFFEASHHVCFGRDPNAFSQMFTGDGYLDTPGRLTALKNFYSADARFARSGIFQVMHHGARGNWHRGVADSIKPVVSIFSSDPNHLSFAHPHAEVLRDFWNFCPVQIEHTRKGFHFLAEFSVS